MKIVDVLPKSIACNEIELMPGLKLVFHVLDNGQQIIEADSFHTFLDWLGDGGEISDEIAFLLAKAVKGQT